VVKKEQGDCWLLLMQQGNFEGARDHAFVDMEIDGWHIDFWMVSIDRRTSAFCVNP